MSRQVTSDRRRTAPHTSMFLRMLLRAAVLRRGHAASAFTAMMVAAATATAMLNLYVGVQAKLRTEFRNYGANVVVVAKEGETLPAGAMTNVNSVLAGRGLAVPFAYIVARTAGGQSVVVAGTDFDQVRKLDRWWSVTAWPNRPQDALIGVRAAALVSPGGKPVPLSFHGNPITLNPSGTLRTGDSEDSRVYLSLDDFEKWTGVQPSTLEIAASGTPEEVTALIHRLSQAMPNAEIRPVRQIIEGEARVMGKTRAMLSAAAVLIILTAALCLLSTLIGWVSDRRRDFAIMKALGASEQLIAGFFAAEAAALGVGGAMAGFVIGVGVAAWIGRVNFHAPVGPRFEVLPAVLTGCIAVSLLAAVLPIFLLRRIEPAMILRGE